MFLNQFHTVCPKIDTEFLGKLGNSNVFSAQNQVVSKKKRKKKVFTGFETDFLAEIGNSNVFSAQNQVVSKKKKKRSSPILRLIFRPEIGNSNIFSSQYQVVSKKKKKKSSPILRLIFWPKSEIQTFERGLFSYGGAIFNFSKRIGLKTTKKVRFCILYKPMGGLEPPRPPPGYATGYCPPLIIQYNDFNTANPNILLIKVLSIYLVG